MRKFACSACDRLAEVADSPESLPKGWQWMRGTPYILCEACGDGSWAGDVSPALREKFARKGIKFPEQ